MVKFIGREKEIAALKHYFDAVTRTEGKTVVVCGEAGIGKTALAQQLMRYTTSKGAVFLNAECTARDIAPYAPFVKAFSDVVDKLIPIEEEISTIEEIFLINNAGLLIAYASKKAATIDKDIVSGMLTAVQDFIRESFAKEDTYAKGLEKLEYGNTTIMIEHGANVFAASVLMGKETPAIKDDMRSTVKIVEEEYGGILSKWDGDFSKLAGVENIIKDLTEKKYVVEPKLDSAIMESKRLKIFEKVLQTCLKISYDNPLVLFLDNIHLADESSLQLIHYISRNIRNAKIMICLTYRTEEVENNPVLVEMLHVISRENLASEIRLEHLDAEDVKALINSLFDKNEFPEEFTKKINEDIGGNPFLITEVLKALTDDSTIYKKGGKWFVKNISEIEMPKTIVDAILYRTNKLDEEAKEVLKYAAVIGRTFEFETLHKCIGMEEEKVANTLEKILDAGIIFENAYLEFDHGVTQECFYNEIPTFKKTIIHKKVGFALEELHVKELDEIAPKLAYHFSAGKVYDKMYLYTIKAGDKAKKLFSLTEASRYYEQALNALENLPAYIKTEKIDLLNKLYEVNSIIGNWDVALKYVLESLKFSNESKDEMQRAMAYRNLAQIYSDRGEWDEALENYIKSLYIFEKNQHIHGIAEVARGLGLVYRRKGDYGKAIENYNRSITQSEKIGDVVLAASAYVDLGLVYKVQGDIELATKYVQKCIMILEKAQDLYELARAYNSLGTIYYQQEDWKNSLECFEKCADISRKIGFIRAEAYGLSNAGEIYAKMNTLEKAMDSCNKAMELFEKLGERYMISMTYQHYGIIYRMKKDWDKSQEYFEKSLKVLTELNVPFDIGTTYFEYALMHKERDSTENAKKYLEKALLYLERVGAKKDIEKIKLELQELK